MRGLWVTIAGSPILRMKDKFRVGITPDFYTDARGYFEGPVQEVFGDPPLIDVGSMPPQPNNFGTPEALNQYDAIVNLAMHVTPQSLQGVERLAIVARWGVGYDRIDVAALTQAAAVLSIPPRGVRAPVAEPILASAFSLSTPIFPLDLLPSPGKWPRDLSALSRHI